MSWRSARAICDRPEGQIRTCRVELDYVARVRRPAWRGFLLLALSLAVAAGLWVEYRDAQLDLARLENASALLSSQRRPASPISKDRLEEQIKSYEAVVRQLAQPWATMMQAMEQVATGDVAILQLEPHAESRLLKITGEARHREAMFEYLRRLEATNGLTQVHLISHQMKLEHPQRPIQFSAQASLRTAR